MKGVGIKSNEGDIRRKGSKHPCHRESRMRPGLRDNEYLSWEVKCRISRRLRRRERERERKREGERELFTGNIRRSFRSFEGGGGGRETRLLLPLFH